VGKIKTNQLIFLLDKHSILNKSQFEFWKNKSTKGTIVTVIKNIVKNLNNELKCNCVLSDLPKAFEYVEHYILWINYTNIGVHGIPHKLIKSSFISRTQQVNGTHTAYSQLKESPRIHGLLNFVHHGILKTTKHNVLKLYLFPSSG
jgi:hypothetical protein